MNSLRPWLISKQGESSLSIEDIPARGLRRGLAAALTELRWRLVRFLAGSQAVVINVSLGGNQSLLVRGVGLYCANCHIDARPPEADPYEWFDPHPAPRAAVVLEP